jgi:hypothetical protein
MFVKWFNEPEHLSRRLYTLNRGYHDERHRIQAPQIQSGIQAAAAKRVLEKGYNQQQAAHHLGISLSTLGR